MSVHLTPRLHWRKPLPHAELSQNLGAEPSERPDISDLASVPAPARRPQGRCPHQDETSLRKGTKEARREESHKQSFAPSPGSRAPRPAVDIPPRVFPFVCYQMYRRHGKGSAIEHASVGVRHCSRPAVAATAAEGESLLPNSKNPIVNSVQNLERIQCDRQAKAELIAHLNRKVQYSLDRDLDAKDQVISNLSCRVEEIDGDRKAKDEVISRLSRELEAIDADRRAKHEVVTRLSGDLEEIETDRQAKDELISRLSRDLEHIETDRRAKEEVIERVGNNLEEVERDRKAKDEVISRLSRELELIDADRRAKDEVIGRVSSNLEVVERDRKAKDELISRLSRNLEEIEADRQGKDEVIERVGNNLEEVERDRKAKDEVISRLSRELEVIDADRRAKDEVIGRVSSNLEEVERDRRAKDEVISRLSRNLEEIEADRQAKDEAIRRLITNLEEVGKDGKAKDEVIGRLTRNLEEIGAPGQVRSVPLDGSALALQTVVDAIRLLAQLVPGQAVLDIALQEQVEWTVPLLRVGQPLIFRTGAPGTGALAEGWSNPEIWGTWSTAERCLLRLKVEPVSRTPLSAELLCQACVHPRQPNLEVECRVGQWSDRWLFPMEEASSARRVVIPKEAIGTDGEVDIHFFIREPRSPAELGVGPDTRPLGLGVKQIRLEVDREPKGGTDRP